MLDSMKTHETLTKLKEKLGKNERLCMIRMKKCTTIENVKTKQFKTRVGLNEHGQIKS